ncbi:hypothetical protein E2C01_072454 [Portunus trituberculatus]|uniref:Uncharacterized protein n=1 Tax=Portunus trituberculatus TaxID=210409 RepID=A0A5B7I6R4_PORTR|nr:hypothetical protein [Portunus trituberculatus]
MAIHGAHRRSVRIGVPGGAEIVAVPKFVEEGRRGFPSVGAPGGGVEAPFAAVHPPHAASGVTASPRSLASLSTSAATHRHHEAKRLILMHLKILFNDATIWHERRAVGSDSGVRCGPAQPGDVSESKRDTRLIYSSGSPCLVPKSITCVGNDASNREIKGP